jgi:hypothetical protein
VVELPVIGEGSSLLFGGVVWARGSLWVSTEDPAGGLDDLLRIDLDTGKILARLENLFPTEIVGDGFLWAGTDTGAYTGAWVRVDTDTNEITPLPEAALHWDGSPQPTFGAVVGEGSVWLPSAENGVTLRLDPRTGRVQGRMSGLQGRLFGVGGGAVWVSGGGLLSVGWADAEYQKPVDVDVPGFTISRFDLATGDLRTINLGGKPSGLAIAGDSVWVAVDVP